MRGKARLDTLADRFWRKVDVNGPVLAHVANLGACWLWTGGKDRKGYGYISAPVDGRVGHSVKAHRAALFIRDGAWPTAQVVMHLCDNPTCVNPEHLRQGTIRDNAVDMVAKGRERNGNTTKAQCHRGHSLTDGNVRRRSNGQRSCRACIRERESVVSQADADLCGLCGAALVMRIPVALRRRRLVPTPSEWRCMSCALASRAEMRLQIEGAALTVREWSRLTGVSTKTIRGRMRKGWSHHECVHGKAAA